MAGAPDAGPAEERVKPCLDCGTIIPFDAEMCSLCGASAGRRSNATSADEEPIKPCMACEALIPASALFCPECGDFTLSVAAVSGSVPPIGSREGGAAAALSRVVAVVIAAAGLLFLAGVLADFARVQDIG